MKVKEILENVCVYLGKEEILDSNLFNETGEEISTLAQKDLNKMVKCLNLILEEIACNYLYIVKEKEIELKNGEINVYDIDDNILEIISIKNKFGKNLRYKYNEDKIVCLASRAVVTYKVYPKEVGIDSIVEGFGGRLTSRVIAYGVASEYCYQEMLYDDASIWETRFKNALLMHSRKKGEIKLKQRGWR